MHRVREVTFSIHLSVDVNSRWDCSSRRRALVAISNDFSYSSSSLSQQLAKRTAKRAKAEAELKVATEADDKNDVDKFSKRLVRVTRDHNEDCKKLLSLMGVPVVTVSTTPCLGCVIVNLIFWGTFVVCHEGAPSVVFISVESCRTFTVLVGNIRV